MIKLDLAGRLTVYSHIKNQIAIHMFAIMKTAFSFWEQGARAVELGWNGLYIGSQKGSVELTGSGGLEIYNAKEPRELLVKLGGFGAPDIDGVYPDYGMKFYKTVGGEHFETLVSTNNGELWLKNLLMVGDGENFIGITGEGAFKPETTLFVLNQTYSAGVHVHDALGAIYVSRPNKL